MADTKISGLTALTGANTASGDLLTIVDVSDTTMAATGTNKKITLTELQSAPVSGGTANGVLYLNGSKVATSGSALTFDGTTLALSPANLQMSNVYTIKWKNASGVSTAVFNYYSDNNFYIDNAYGAQIFRIGASGTPSEAMRLTSTGLGIGTSSPGAKLHSYSVATLQSQLLLENPNNEAVYARFKRPNREYYLALDINNNGGTGFSLYDATAAATRWTVDSSGNLGLGVTPSAWSVYRAFDIGRGSLVNASTETDLVHNAFWNGSNWIYRANDFASRHLQINGQHRFFTAPSGTAGNAITFTQAMTLDSAGLLGVGISSPNVAGGTAGTVIHVHHASQAQIHLTNDTTGSTSSNGSNISVSGLDLYINNRQNGFTAFYNNGSERARIDSSGNLLVGTTSSSGGKVQVVSGTAGTQCYLSWNTAASGTRYFHYFGVGSGASPTGVGSITSDGSVTAYNTSSDYRLKDNQQPLTGSGAFIDALQPKTWNWKADGSRGVGFIAHEVQEVSPGSVVGEKDGEQMQAMEYGSAEFIANIIAELQSLRARVAQLESN